MKCVMGKIISSGNEYDRMLVDDGKIIALDNEKTAPQDAEVIELAKNQVLIPPLADCHTHFFQTGIYLGALDLSKISTKSELFSFLRWATLNEYRIGEVVWAFGFDPLDNMPTADELQSLAPDVPIFLRRIDGHSCSLSSAAMKMLPAEFKNLPEDGIFSGEQQEKVVEYFLKKLDERTLIDAAFRVAEYAKSAGAFVVHSLVPFVEWAELLLKIEEKLPVKLEIFVETTDVERVKSLGLNQIGGCILLDGSFGSHTAAVSLPYDDEPQKNGVLYFTDDKLKKFFQAALKNDIAVAMHAIGDRAIEQYLRVAEYVAGENSLRRWRIEHSELISPEQIDRAANLGLNLSVQPAFENRWGGSDGLYAKRLGERWRRTNPFRREVDSGILLLGGSDSYITPIDPVSGIFYAMHHPNERQRLNFKKSLEMFSKNVGIWMEKNFGEFKIGKIAEGVIVDGGFDGESPPEFIVWGIV